MKDFVPAESSILRIAESIKESTGGLWDFGEEYALLNQEVNFNYQALSRAVKDQHGVDLYPPSVATKLRKAYEKFVVECEVSKAHMKNFSPYYMYELLTIVDINKKNVHIWLDKASQTARDALIQDIKHSDKEPREPSAMIRVPESVFARIHESRNHLGNSVSMPRMSITVFMEFVTELVLNTNPGQLRRLWDVMHGEGEEER